MTTVDFDCLRNVEQFLYREARLLDEREWDAWLALWAGNAQYLVPARFNRFHGRGETTRPIPAELSGPEDLSWILESKLMLATRIAKLKTGRAWSEEPPSRTRRLITNIEAIQTDIPDVIQVWSNFLLYRSRKERDVEIITGQRQDLLRRLADGFLIQRRQVILDATVLLAPDLGCFF